MKNAILFFSLLFLLTKPVLGQVENESFYNNFFKGLEYFNNEDYSQAKKYYALAWEEAKTFEDTSELKTNSAAVLATTLFILGEYEKANPIYEITVRLLESQNKTDEEVYFNTQISYTQSLFAVGDYSKAIRSSIILKDLTEQGMGKNSLDYSLRTLDLAYAYQGAEENANALIYFEEAEALLNTLGHSKEPFFIDMLYYYGLALMAEGKNAAAEQKFIRVSELAEFVEGADEFFLGDIEFYIIQSELLQEKFENGIPRLINNIKKVQEIDPESHIRISIRAKALGAQFQRIKKFDEALNYFELSKVSYEAMKQSNTPDFADLLFGVGYSHFHLGDYSEAEIYYNKALDLLIELGGEGTLDHGHYLSSMAYLKQTLGDFKISEKLHLEALDIIEKNEGDDSPVYALELMNYAVLFKDIGSYDLALKIHKDALTITQDKLGVESRQYGDHCLNLAEVYYLKADYKNSIKYNRIAAKIYQEKAREDDPVYAFALNALALSYMGLGDFDTSEKMLLEAIGHVEKTLTKDHYEYGKLCQNLGKFYHTYQDRLNALYYYDKALSNYEITIKNRHHNYGNLCAELGRLHHELGNRDKALEFIEIALDVLSETHGPDSFYFASVQQVNGLIQMGNQNFNDALESFQEASRVFDLIHGADNDYKMSNYFFSALTYHLMGDYKSALNNYKLYNIEILEHVEEVFTYRSENDKRKFVKGLGDWLNFHQSLLLNENYESVSLVEEAFNNNLKMKGVLLNSSKDLVSSLLSLDNDDITQKINNFRSLKKKLSNSINLPANERGASVDSLKNAINDLETELVELYSSKFDDDFVFNKDWKSIHDKLETNEVIIEFSTFRVSKIDGFNTDNINYSAFLLRKDWDAPKLVHLFEESEIISLLKAKSPNQIYATRGSKGQSVTNTKGIYELIWKPLESHLEGIETVYFSPSGILNQIPFAALGSDNAPMLSSQYNLVQLSSTYNITTSATLPQPDQTLFIGGIDYNSVDTTSSEEVVVDFLNMKTTKDSDGTRSRGDSWNYLKGTLAEVNTIQGLYDRAGKQYHSWTGDKASEANFKALSGQSPKILHIATHGFFYENLTESVSDNPMTNTNNQYQYAEDPLFRSALILSGANEAWINGSKDPETDGILTAMEISNLDLANTDMVVLSACETGLGDIDGSEGVYGLQRAFKMAGVDIIVMSLWEVPDKETAEFMTLFYSKWLEGLDVRNAFNDTQKVMQERYKEEPLKWAAFVLFE